jgi:hypothetical protein
MTDAAPYTPTDADRKFAEAATERARLQAATYLPQLLDIVAEKAFDPSASPKSVLDAAEFTYKVSGLAKKQEEQNDKGRFVFNINFRSGTVSVEQEKVIEHDPPTELQPPEDPVGELLANPPESIHNAIKALPVDDALDLSFDNLED